MSNEDTNERAMRWCDKHKVTREIRFKMAVLLAHYPSHYFSSDNPEKVLRRAYTEAMKKDVPRLEHGDSTEII